MIKLKPSQYLTSPGKLDELSVTELEHLMTAPSGSYLYRLLFATKMSQPYHPSFAVLNNDFVLRTFGVGENFPWPQLGETADNSQELPETGESHVVNIKDTVMSESDIDESMTMVSESKSENSWNEDIKQMEHFTHMTNDSKSDEKNELSASDNFSENSENENTSATLTKGDDNEEKRGQKNSKRKHKKKKKSKKQFELNEFSGISGYSKWLLSFHRDDVEKKIAKEKKAEKKRRLAEIARKSITKSNEVASEPLADLLAQQGHFDDAKKMYEQLMHKNPEKSRYFAAKLEDLLKNIENSNL